MTEERTVKGALLGCVICLAALACTLPIVILAMTRANQNIMTCTPVGAGGTAPPATPSPSGTNLADTIGVSTWLYVHASVGLLEAVIWVVFVVSLVIFQSLGAMAAVMCLLVLVGLFRLPWLIVGSVMFWRDCPNLYPSQMNGLMWATLILGLIGVFFGCVQQVAASKNRKNVS